MQTYEEYLDTMAAYRFHPMDRKLWEEWQIHYRGAFKPSASEDNQLTLEGV